MSLADLLPQESRSPGLSAVELRVAQEEAGAAFPDDLCEFLTATLPRGDRFPDWRGRPNEVMEEWRVQVIDGIHFDVINNVFWLDEWGDRPSDERESRQVVAAALADAPALIPVCGHRAIPNDPLVAGNPVYSVWQTDIIIYGSNLAEYLGNEFKRRSTPGDSFRVSHPRTIRFWSHLVG